MEMAYREGGGLLLPTLATEEEAAANLGPFALMRDEYLRSSKPELRADLLAQGALARHLAETEALAEAMADDLAARVAKSRGLDEAAKVADPAAWAAYTTFIAAASRAAPVSFASRRPAASGWEARRQHKAPFRRGRRTLFPRAPPFHVVCEVEGAVEGRPNVSGIDRMPPRMGSDVVLLVL